MNRGVDFSYASGFCSVLLSQQVEEETNPYLRDAQNAGRRMALDIRRFVGPGRVTQLMEKTADAQAMRVNDHRRIMLRWEKDGALERERPPALEPCATCRWITICAVAGTTCKSFRRYASTGVVSICIPRGPPDATWQESWEATDEP